MNDGKNRQSILMPVAIPVAALLAIGVVLFAFSRVLLQITATAAWVTALIAAAGIMSVATYVATRRSVSGGSILSMVGAVTGISMLAGGIALFAAQRGGEAADLPTVVIRALPGASTDGFAEETRSVTAPAGEPFQIEFDNQDTSAQHNVVIATEEGGAQLFREPPFVGGPEPRFWEVEPLEEGSYFFFCEVHPTTMTGSLEATRPITVVAEGSAFDTDEITLPANTPTPIVFENKDPGIEHNLSIAPDDTFSEPIFQGQTVFGPSPGVTYEIPALEEGTYPFRCDIHPATMVGTVTVEAAAGPTGGEPPPEPTGGG